jgi:hypothetical protein
LMITLPELTSKIYLARSILFCALETNIGLKLIALIYHKFIIMDILMKLYISSIK